MEMRASEDVGRGQDITPPLSPLASALYDSYLLSHCSSCFSLLPSSFSCIPYNVPPLRYCSPSCSAASSAAEHHLLLLRPHLRSSFSGDTSDLRAALRLLLHDSSGDRVCGLLTNREKLLSCGDDEVVERVLEGAKAMAIARSLRDGVEFSEGTGMEDETAALCAVITNAVEVQASGDRRLGIAVYGTAFSWINHSCSPNACYRFLTSPPAPERKIFLANLGFRIVPSGNGVEKAVSVNRDSARACEGFGPKVVIRSIQPMKRGEEVTIAYTDLLQPKALRQSELCQKYQFVCNCRRCSAFPSTYVDNALEKIIAASHDHDYLAVDINLYRDGAITTLTNDIDDAISDYLLASDPEACCGKLEKILTQGTIYQHSEPNIGDLELKLRLHPLHHLALNAYTTLASACKTHAGNLLSSQSEKSDRPLDVFSMIRTSAAYQLLLAGASHHLYLSEGSLIASVANFWSNAGESLLSLARSSLWDMFLESSSPRNCCDCTLIDKFEPKSSFARADYADLDIISKEFLDCIGMILPDVWGFLAYSCRYLEQFKDPLDFRWGMESSDDGGQLSWQRRGGCPECGGLTCVHKPPCKLRENVSKLGFHCLLYGRYLLSICYGGETPQ